METEISALISNYISQVFDIINERYDIPLSILNDIYHEVHKNRNNNPSSKHLISSSIELELESKDKINKKQKSIKTTVSPSGNYSEDYLRKCTKDELTRLCKLKKLKTGGNKDDLVKRIIGLNKPSIVSKIFKCSPIHVVKNEFGNRVHVETKLVFSEDRIVIGVQNNDGSIGDLNEELIDLCNQYKFKYKLPVNLDSNTKVEELDEKIAVIINEEKKLIQEAENIEKENQNKRLLD